MISFDFFNGILGTAKILRPKNQFIASIHPLCSDSKGNVSSVQEKNLFKFRLCFKRLYGNLRYRSVAFLFANNPSSCLICQTFPIRVNKLPWSVDEALDDLSWACIKNFQCSCLGLYKVGFGMLPILVFTPPPILSRLLIRNQYWWLHRWLHDRQIWLSISYQFWQIGLCLQALDHHWIWRPWNQIQSAFLDPEKLVHIFPGSTLI